MEMSSKLQSFKKRMLGSNNLPKRSGEEANLCYCQAQLPSEFRHFGTYDETYLFPAPERKLIKFLDAVPVSIQLTHPRMTN
jgi:hypothetical protein